MSRNLKSLPVESTTTTIKASEFRVGPNMVVFVASDQTLADVPDALKILPSSPIKPFTESVDSKPQVDRLNRTVYLFDNEVDFKHEHYKKFVVVMTPSNEILPSGKQTLNLLAEKWKSARWISVKASSSLVMPPIVASHSGLIKAMRWQRHDETMHVILAVWSLFVGRLLYAQTAQTTVQPIDVQDSPIELESQTILFDFRW